MGNHFLYREKDVILKVVGKCTRLSLKETLDDTGPTRKEKKMTRRKCPKCGEWTRVKGPYCPNCSKPLTSEESYPIIKDPDEDLEEERGGIVKTILWIFAIIVLIILLILTGWFLRGCLNHDNDNQPPIPISSEESSEEIDLRDEIGFSPDKNLIISDLKAEKLGLDKASLTSDFNTYLNTKREGFEPLAGYTDGTNDYNQYYNHQSAPQVPAYSWMIHTGEYIEMPGIGKLQGGKGHAVMVLIINRTDKVYRFPTNSVTVIAGFQGWGRIWNGESKEVIETEKRLTNHYLTRLGLGIPEKGFIGQADGGADNASTVTVVTVEMIQVGQFRLIRAETVSTIKE